MGRLFGLIALLAALTACGSAYIPQDVRQSGADSAVRVVPLTNQSVLIANRETPYTPRQLPAAFNQTAGVGAGIVGAGALPESPLQPEQRPTNLPLRVPPPVQQGPYVIGVGDTLVLATRQGGNTVEELSGLLAAQNRRQGYLVQDDGTITIPDVGRISVGGLNLADAEAEVFRRLVENQIDPSFSLEVAEFRSQRVSIGGAVRNPAIVPISLNPLTLNEAITQAGGLTTNDPDYAIIRLFRDGSLYQIPLRDFYGDEDLQRLRLVDGDSVFVDTAYELDRAQAYFEQQIRVMELRQASRSQALNQLESEVALRRAELDERRQNFRDRLELGAVERDYVYLAGEVGEQSRFPLPYGQTASLADALFEGRGLQAITANPAQIYVLRASNDAREFGAVTAWHLDGSNAVNVTLATRMELRPNDIIFVAAQPITRWNRVVQQIVPSLITSGVGAITN